jgi:TetR/AcrR family transcriptional regulator, cholesterol catabolism regulator
MQEIEKKNKKQEIYRAAAKLFKEKGYNATSMRDLAESVHLKASSLYSHIGSKEEILIKICFDNAARFTEGMDKVEKLNCSVAKKIEALLQLHIRTAIEETTAVTVFNDEWRHLSEPHLSDFIKMRKDYENRFRKIIKKGIEDGELKNLSAEIFLFSLLNSVHWLHNWYKPEGKIKPDELENDIITMLMKGIRSGKNKKFKEKNQKK